MENLQNQVKNTSPPSRFQWWRSSTG